MDALGVLQKAQRDFDDLQAEGVRESPERARIRLCAIANKVFQSGAVEEAIQCLRKAERL